MDTKWQPTMMSAISEVLETMFFESVDFGAPEAEAMSWYCESTIGFSNAEHRRTISIRLVEPFARMIATNFLGENADELGEEDMADVMRELANMVGGNFLGRLSDEEWRLEIPAFRLLQGPVGGASGGLSLGYMGERVGVVSVESEA